jgi:hypothetical protein
LAQGHKSRAICDRCGWEYALKSLRVEWTNLKVCPECFESKHPQLTPTRKTGDNVTVPGPRPDNDDMGAVSSAQSTLGLGNFTLTYPPMFGT